MDAIEFSDDELRRALIEARSKTDFYQRLGFSQRPGQASHRRVSKRAEEIGMDVSVLTKPGRSVRWSRDELAEAVANSSSWAEASRTLGSNWDTVKRSAQGIGLDTSHLSSKNHLAPLRNPLEDAPVALNRAGFWDAAQHLACAWYSMRGFRVLLPSAPEAADLYAVRDDVTLRVQVKSSTGRAAGAFSFSVMHRAGRGLRTHDSKAVDEFFLVTALGDLYRVPKSAVDEAAVQSIFVGSSGRWDPFRVSMFE